MPGPLSGYRVLDLSRVLAGPWASQMLADMGADVIKIERPGSGDDTRHWGPPYLKNNQGEETGESAYYLCANRGKKSISIDITHPRGQEIIRKLAAESDVLLENFKVGGLQKYELDFARLQATCPKLVYCSITGFGQTGPYAHRPGYDVLIQGMGGLMSITGSPDDGEGGGPMKAGVAVSDLSTGLYAANAILAALLERERSGLGQHIDLGLLDVQAAMLANQAANYLVGGVVPGRLGNAQPNVVPYEVFASADGELILAIGNDRQFTSFCSVTGRPDLATDPRFATNPMRVENRQLISSIVADILSEQPSDHWLTELDKAGVPCGPINAIDQVFADPQIRSRDMVLNIRHPLGADLRLPGNPIKYSRTPLQTEQAPPMLGEHTNEVLRELLGLSSTEIDELRSLNVIGQV